MAPRRGGLPNKTDGAGSRAGAAPRGAALWKNGVSSCCKENRMRYLKALVLAILIFLALVFFFQNQTALSQQLELTLNLFFIPPMTSIPLPFYFLVIAAFFVGALLSLALLFWDRCNTSAKLVKSRWHISSLEKELARLKKDITGGDSAKHSFFHRKENAASAPAPVAQAPAAAPAPAAKDPGETADSRA